MAAVSARQCELTVARPTPTKPKHPHCIVEDCPRPVLTYVGAPEGAPVCAVHNRQWLDLPKEMRVTPRRRDRRWIAQQLQKEQLLERAQRMQGDLTRFIATARRVIDG